MLVSLLVKDFALLESIEVSFAPGLNIVTGETGAGKSILVDALGLALGERSDTTMIRDGAVKTIVEAVFEKQETAELRAIIAEAGVEDFPQLILRREVSHKGQSRCFINDTPVPVATLRTVGDLLVDLHGQHQHQSLLKTDAHLDILDAFGEMEPVRADYTSAFTRFRGAVLELEELLVLKRNAEERRAVVEYQRREIGRVNPRTGEDEEIERDLRLLEHAERLVALCDGIISELYDADGAAIGALARSGRLIDELGTIDPTLEQLREENASAVAQVEEIVRTIRDYAGTIEFDPERVEKMRMRLSELTGLKRRFGFTLTEILEKRDELEKEFESIDSMDEDIARIEKELPSLRRACAAAAARLTVRRSEVAANLGKQTEKILKDLAIARPAFRTVIHPSRDADRGTELYLEREGTRIVPNGTGWDRIEFHLSTNAGEEPKPLARVVSGGEVSRIMLSLKSILAGRDTIPLMVFDEIDVGVSGRIAQKVGTMMKKLSRVHQIIAITHLPQIAALADHHLLVEKRPSGKRTVTEVRVLAGDERQMEVARLLGGEEVTASNLASARELMEAG